MKIEVGGVYKTREGKRVEIVKNDGHAAYPFLGDNGGTYTENGKFWLHESSPRDLIAEWQDTTTDYNDGKWHGWNGGECPVHPDTVVDVVWQNNDSGRVGIHKRNKAYIWDENNERINWPAIIAFRVVTPYKEPREITIDGVKYREVTE
jgi:hypothetical protein